MRKVHVPVGYGRLSSNPAEAPVSSLDSVQDGYNSTRSLHRMVYSVAIPLKGRESARITLNTDPNASLAEHENIPVGIAYGGLAGSPRLIGWWQLDSRASRKYFRI